MKIMQTIKDERGFALVMALVVMAAMTAIGLAAVTSSTTDLMIAKNEKEAKMAFYLAEAGIEEAIARLSLDDDDTWYKGETYTMANSDRDDRWADSTTATLGKSFSSHGANSLGNLGYLSALGGTYAVTMEYAYEENSGDTWCKGGTCDVTDEVVVYCYSFIRGNTPTDCDTGFPVYEITSTGTTVGGTSAKIVSYVSAAALNLLPPGNTILFTEGEIFVANNKTIDGKVASIQGSAAVAGCIYDAGDDTENCDDISDSGTEGVNTWEPSYGFAAGDADNNGAMIDYLGMSIDTLKSYADVSDVHPTENNSSMGISDSKYSSQGGFGTMCDTDASGAGDPDFESHICDNRPQIIVIDNYDEAGSKSWGPVKITGGTGRGLLIITGDLEISGNFTWEGMIFVMGELDVAGTAVVYGTLMIEGDDTNEAPTIANADVKINGSLAVYGSRPVASSVAIGMSVPKMLRWTRL